jgi:glyoxylase-like metal-dependent hydrolase (beta-lactamase superfamily II)
MFFQHLTTGPLMVNCFVLGDENSKEAVVIDPGGNEKDIARVLDEQGLSLNAIVLTHGHWDHTGGADGLRKLTGGRVLIHPDENYKDFQPDGSVQGGDRVPFGPYALAVLDTPGHSPGGVSLHLPEGQAVFVGDLLFAGSIGRTDLPGGSMDVLLNSVKDKIFPLGDQTKVLPGHGPMTTVGQEKSSNPFLRGVVG